MEDAYQEMDDQALVWKHIYGFVNSMLLKCALDLGLFDIIHHHARPITLDELASSLPFPSVNSDCFRRILRYLVHMKLLAYSENAYSLTPASKLLLKDEKKSLASFAILNFLEMPAWHYLSTAVEGTGDTPWERYHGVKYLEDFTDFGEGYQVGNDAMTSLTGMMVEALVQALKYGSILEGATSLVDVGGSTGVAAAAIAAAFPGIRCAVFDIPDVIAAAPERAGVERISGDIFVLVPKADVILIKSVLHDWDDEDCMKILKKCKEALPESGKVVVVDIVLDEELSITSRFTGPRLSLDLSMMVTVGGKERSRDEWAALIKGVGYSRYKITPMAAIESIIEIFP